MKKFSRVFLSLVLPIILVCNLLAGLVIVNAASTVLANENFEDGQANGFTATEAGWKAVKDGTNTVYNGKAPVTRLISGEATAESYSIEAKVKVGAKWEPDSDNGNATGFVARYKDRGNSYMFIYNFGQASWKILKKVNDKVTTIQAKAEKFTHDKWYNLKVVVNGNKLEFYVDGALKVSAVDTSFKAGKFGMFVSGSMDSYYDDFVVTDLGAAVAPAATPTPTPKPAPTATPTPVPTPTPAPVSVVIDGQKMTFEVDPVIVEGRTMVPMRAIFEKFGATIAWDDATKTVTATKGDKVIVLKIGDKSATVSGTAVTVDPPAQIVNSRTMVPLRFISETLGATVDWNGDTRTVTITMPK